MDIRYILRIKNFKSLQDIELELKPLTFLFGANGSGKSSILKAIRFLSANLNPTAFRQTIYQIDEHINLESFSEVVINNDLTKNITLEIECIVVNTEVEEKNEEYGKNEGNMSEIQAKDEPYENFENNVSYFDDDEDFTEDNVTAGKIMAKEILDNENDFWDFLNRDRGGVVRSRDGLPLPRSFKFRIEFSNNNKKSNIELIRIQDNELNIFFEFYPALIDWAQPYNYVRVISVSSDSQVDKIFNDFYKELSSIPFINRDYEEYLMDLKNYLFYTVRNTGYWEGLEIEEKRELFERFQDFYRTIFEDIPDLIRDYLSLYHIPTVRLIPQCTYALHNQRFNEKEYYGIPFYLEGKGGSIDIKLLNKWLTKFEMARQLKIKKDKYVGHILYRPLQSNHWYNLSEGSSGFLQLLPILFKILERYGILIEQPELHLHPRLQSKLAELFSGNLSYKWNIIETHSEHIIRKIQILVSKDSRRKKSLNLIDKVKVYFLEKDKETGYTKMSEMKLDNLGRFINDWPNGFFDTDTDLALEFFREISRN